MKKEIGFSKLIPIATFNDPSKGYLMNDKCVFGAKVLLVPRSTGWGEHLRMLNRTSKIKPEWKIQNFSQMKEEYIYAAEFIDGSYTWNIKMYPKGKDGRNKSMSVYLCLADSDNFTQTLKVYTEFTVYKKSTIPGS